MKNIRSMTLLLTLLCAAGACTNDPPATFVSQDTGSDVPAADVADRGDASQCVSGDQLCSDECTWLNDDDCPTCGPEGMLTPMLTCSAAHPCDDLLVTYTNANITDPPLTRIDTPSFVTGCSTNERGINSGRPQYDDGEPITTTDAEGSARYRCEFRPAGTTTDSKRPLLVFVHGSGGYADTLYSATSLRTKAEAFDLSGDPERPGFILVAAQARNLHWPTVQPQDGAKHDTFYRDLSSPSANLDIAYYDEIIDSLVEEGVVDPARIYISGWSNGARFAGLYAIARHDTPTPGGNRIAAVANYSGTDPFSNTHHEQDPSCQQETYPTSQVPLMLVSRTCDVMACNEAQDEAFRDRGTDTSPGNVASTWVETLRTRINNPNVTWLPITGRGEAVAEGTCGPVSLCTSIVALLNHVRWPDGIDDSSDEDHEPTMLGFLRDNPLS